MVNFRNFTALVAALVPFGAAAPAPAPRDDPTPDVAGKFIVTLKSGISARDLDSHLSWVDAVHKRSLDRRDTTGVEKKFNVGKFSGYSGHFDDATVEELRNNPDVCCRVSILSLPPPPQNPLLLSFSNPTLNIIVSRCQWFRALV